ncbi:T-cell receptor alpha chain V region CTL-L17 [Fukomys damarensis]|nr:T-cell receptor alpha chain V region CTL-L17 [Fukomys damarensis]
METLLHVLVGMLGLQAAWVSSQELQQSQSLVTQEGEDITINCNSSQTLYALHWYRQNGGGPVFLLMLQKGRDEKSHGNIAAKLDDKKQQSSLHITAARPSHSGTYFCAGNAQ